MHVANGSRNDERLKLRRRFHMISEQTGQTLAFGMTEFAAMRLSTARATRMHADYVAGYPLTLQQQITFRINVSDNNRLRR